MIKQNPILHLTVLLVFLLGFAGVAKGQANLDRERDAPSETDLRYKDYRKVTEPVSRSMERYEEFSETVFAPVMEAQLRSMGPTGKPEIPHSLRSQLIRELKQVHSAVQLAVDQSKSYTRFKRDEAECRLWIEVIQFYLDGMSALTEEMSRNDVTSGEFAIMTMNQLPTALFGVGSVHAVVLPCFVQKGKYIQPLFPFLKEKADELRGLTPSEPGVEPAGRPGGE